jgi:hypothetical protein
MTMGLPVSRTVLITELASTISILESWKKLLSKEGSPGIPGMDYDGTVAEFAACMEMFKGELVICAGKCENLAEAIHNWQR